MKLVIIYAIYLFVMSIVAFILFLADKKKAEKGKPRTPEKILLYFSVIGGAIGAFFGRIASHHKTNKKYFSLIIYLSLFLDIVILGLIIGLTIF